MSKQRKVVACTDYWEASAFIKALDKLSSLTSKSLWVFRGQSDGHWRLIPSALRRNAWSTLDGLNSVASGRNELFEQMTNEMGAVVTFAREADRQGLQVPGYDTFVALYASTVMIKDGPLWKRLNSILDVGFKKGLDFPPAEWESMFGMAQHYGIPTRLLDWSESAFAATYFAAIEPARRFHFNPRIGGKWLRVWALDLDRLWQLNPSTRWGRIKVVRAPWATNPNLCAQRGLFTVHCHMYKKGKGAKMSFGELVTAPDGADTRIIPIPRPRQLNDVVEGLWDDASEEIRELYLDTPVMQSLRLPWSQAPKLLELLKHEGITAASLFPGYAGATRYLRELRFHRPLKKYAPMRPGFAI